MMLRAFYYTSHLFIPGAVASLVIAAMQERMQGLPGTSPLAPVLWLILAALLLLLAQGSVVIEAHRRELAAKDPPPPANHEPIPLNRRSKDS